MRDFERQFERFKGIRLIDWSHAAQPSLRSLPARGQIDTIRPCAVPLLAWGLPCMVLPTINTSSQMK